MGNTGYGGEKRKRRGRQKKKTKREEEMDSEREGESHLCVRVLNSGFKQPQAGVGEDVDTKYVTFPCNHYPLKLQQNNIFTLY